MFPLVEELNVPYILMHMQGNPRNMQDNPVYDDVVADILRWFAARIFRLQSSGVKDIIIDPGFGFGKTKDHNFELLRRLSDFSVAGLPLLVGVSRKSMIWKTLDITADDALNGTTALNAIALMNGADILRVHDVKEAVQAVKLICQNETKYQIISNSLCYLDMIMPITILDIIDIVLVATILFQLHRLIRGTAAFPYL